MSKSPPTPRELIDRLDTRHNELLAKLDELNAQIESALSEFVHSREAVASPDEIRRAA